jgi:hypothetical protein
MMSNGILQGTSKEFSSLAGGWISAILTLQKL